MPRSGLTTPARQRACRALELTRALSARRWHAPACAAGRCSRSVLFHALLSAWQRTQHCCAQSFDCLTAQMACFLAPDAVQRPTRRRPRMRAAAAGYCARHQAARRRVFAGASSSRAAAAAARALPAATRHPAALPGVAQLVRTDTAAAAAAGMRALGVQRPCSPFAAAARRGAARDWAAPCARPICCFTRWYRARTGA